jgi:hypothetical protein
MQSWIVLLVLIEEARLIRAVGAVNLPRLLWACLLRPTPMPEEPDQIVSRPQPQPKGGAA